MMELMGYWLPPTPTFISIHLDDELGSGRGERGHRRAGRREEAPPDDRSALLTGWPCMGGSGRMKNEWILICPCHHHHHIRPEER